MARLRYNGVRATLGADLLAAATTITFTSKLTHAAGDVPTIGGADYLPLYILDADGRAVEIVHLTAYTTGATTGTVTRAQESTTAALRAEGLAVLHGPTVADADLFLAANGITVQDENANVSTGVTQIDFQGAGVTATSGTGEVVVTISGGGSSPTVKTINAQTGTAYTLVLGDGGFDKFLTMSNAAASTLTVPPNSSVAFPVGTIVEGAQLGAGQVTLTPGSGVTINGTPGLKVAAQYGSFGLLKTATDTWLAFGRLSA